MDNLLLVDIHLMADIPLPADNSLSVVLAEIWQKDLLLANLTLLEDTRLLLAVNPMLEMYIQLRLAHKWWADLDLLGCIAIATGKMNVTTTVGLCARTASELRLKSNTKFK